MFDSSVMTITAQAAGGSGSWRLWHYVVVDDVSVADMLEVGFFNGMANQIHPGDMVTVNAPSYAALLVLSKVASDIVATSMVQAELPADSEPTGIQNLPQGTQPAGFVLPSAEGSTVGGNSEVDPASAKA